MVSNRKESSLQEQDNINSIGDIILVYGKNIRLFIYIPFIICILTILYVLFIAQPVYTSKTKIVSSTMRANASQLSGLASQIGLNLQLGQPDQNYVYEDIIKSRTIAEKILKKKFDTKRYGKEKTLLQIITYGDDDPKFSFDTLKYLGIEKFLLEMVNVSKDIQTGIHTISVNSIEPYLSYEIASSIIDELQNHQQEYNKTITSKTRHFIEDRISETKSELEKAEETLKNFRQQNRRIENSFLLQMEEERLTREVTVLTGVFTTLKQQLETTKIEEVRVSDYIVVVDPPFIPVLRSSPKRKKAVVVSFILSFGLSFILVLLKHRLVAINRDEKRKISKGVTLLLVEFPIIEKLLGLIKRIFKK